MAQRTCTHPGCAKPHRARGLCGSHYNQTYQPNRHQPQQVPCAACGAPVLRTGGGKRRTACSYRCRYYLTYGRHLEEGKELVGPVPRQDHPRPQREREVELPRIGRVFIQGDCAWCGTPFTRCLPRGTHTTVCSNRCAARAAKARRELVRGRFDIPARRRQAIYQRDGWVCQLCREDVDPTLGPNDKWAASLDHIECQSRALVPDHSDANLRLAHRMCNSIRGARTAA